MISLWTPEAEDNLLVIVRRLNAFSMGAGDRFADRLRSRIHTLELTPFMGREVPEFGTPLLRELILRPYRVIYEVFPDRVEIVAIRHGRQRLHPVAED